MNNLFDLLPMFPWEGPPLPRFLSIYWPFYRASSASLSSRGTLQRMFSGVQESTSITPSLSMTQNNLEEIDFPDGFDPDTFMPRKIRIRRKTERRDGINSS
jgi:hypothetical protein